MAYAKALVRQCAVTYPLFANLAGPIFECALVLIAHIAPGREPIKPETLGEHPLWCA
jgi:hypothetical protein